jgi:hypothetical protein
MGLHTIVVAQRARDHHLAIRLRVFAMSTSPKTLPWLRLCVGGRIPVSADFGEEVFTSDCIDRLLVLRSHLRFGQCHQGLRLAHTDLAKRVLLEARVR